jgi:hypothetical protein
MVFRGWLANTTRDKVGLTGGGGIQVQFLTTECRFDPDHSHRRFLAHANRREHDRREAGPAAWRLID